jgi:hypothetical protein
MVDGAATATATATATGRATATATAMRRRVLVGVVRGSVVMTRLV